MFRPKTDRISYGGALIGKAEKRAINKVIDSQGGRRWTIGEESVKLEGELAKEFGVKKAVLTNSGSSALLVALTALHLPKGSKVVVPACNFPTAFNAILQCGLVPVVVDVDILTLNVDIWEVKKALKKYSDITAIIVVDIAGNPVNLPMLRIITDTYNPAIKIILDNCDGSGTLYGDKYIDNYADVSCISMHAAHIITMGEGGAVLTNDEEVGNRAFKIREWGRESGSDKIYSYEGLPYDYRERYTYTEIGYNVKPLELQCAMGRIQLKKMTRFREMRAKNYEALRNIFKDNDNFDLIQTVPHTTPCWFSFPLLVRGYERSYVMDTLEANNIECRTIFSGNITRHPAYKDVEYKKIGSLKNSDDIMQNGMFLSVHPSITSDMIKFIGKVISEL